LPIIEIVTEFQYLVNGTGYCIIFLFVRELRFINFLAIIINIITEMEVEA